MSRRKQSTPRQIKRSMGELEEGEDNLPDNMSLSGEEGGPSDTEDLPEGDGSSPAFTPAYNEEPAVQESPEPPDEKEEEKDLQLGVDENDKVEEDQLNWVGPEELDLSEVDGIARIVTLRDLTADTMWGPYAGNVHAEDAGEGHTGEAQRHAVVCEDPECWLNKLVFSPSPKAANCIVYREGDQLFCKVSRDVQQGESLLATLLLPKAEDQMLPIEAQSVSVKEEPAYPAALHPEIQLLPQQAGMAAILATAVVNKDIFPCKDCGIWYRSERNLQAHLMYYCASRQKQGATSPPQDKPKDSYPNERICPFPHCKKSCPSASSLEIHMRTHSGERPFVCLICLSAFTTKANCERHLKVHTDTVSGVCHGCGFVSTTRDILYSHLVTSHMVCQPGSRSEVYSPGVASLGTAGRSLIDKCQVCGFVADSPSLLQQHVRTHLEAKDSAEKSPNSRQSVPSTENDESQDQKPSASVARADSSSPGSNGTSATPREGPSPVVLTPVRKIKEEPRSDSETASEEAQEKSGKQSSQSSSPKSTPMIQVKAELPSPTPGSSPVHLNTVASMQPAGTVTRPQYMFGAEAAIIPQASEILAKMSEMVHSRLKQGQSPGGVSFYVAGSPVQKGATCFECDITFNNVNNFYVHKRLYCSSRHQQGDTPGTTLSGKEKPVSSVSYDSSPVLHGNQVIAPSHGEAEQDVEEPPGDSKKVDEKNEDQRLKDGVSSEGESGGQASEGSQSPGGSTEDGDDDPTRTFCQACNIRFSRHENYTVHKRFYCASRHDPSNQRQLHGGKAAFQPQPIRTRKRKKMYEIHMARAEALSLKQEHATSTSRIVPAPSPSTSPEGDGPIDLSKKPRLREGNRMSLPALPLTDYHKCTACNISFNSIENYLGHKTFYCPATSLQPQQIKRPTSTSPNKKNVEHYPEVKDIKSEPVPVATKSPVPPFPKSQVGPSGMLPVVCPYCPPNGVVAGDLMEHFRSVHGLVVTLQPALSRSPKDDYELARHSEGQSAPDSPAVNSASKDPPPTTPPNLASTPLRDGINGRVKREPTSPSSPLVNGSPVGSHVGGVSPLTGALLTVSPVPDAVAPVATSALPDKVAPGHAQLASKAALIPPLQNGNVRFCRLCNIKFSSLSTFIAHKKYYCSSHSAEHVK